MLASGDIASTAGMGQWHALSLQFAVRIEGNERVGIAESLGLISTPKILLLLSYESPNLINLEALTI